MSEALPYLVKALTAGIYSPMLRETWRTWRAIMTSEMGQSKDSDIPNAEYNQLRMISCYTMLCYIHDHPKDWLHLFEMGYSYLLDRLQYHLYQSSKVVL